MILQGKILLVLGVICSIIGVIAKLLSSELVNGDYLLFLGLILVLIARGFPANRNNQSKKQQISDWIFLFLIVIGGILFYLRMW